MPKKNRKPSPVIRWAHAVRQAVVTATRFLSTWLCQRRRAAVEVVIADEAKRKALRRDITRTLSRLQRVFRHGLPADVLVVAQQVIPMDHQPAGCFQLTTHPDGSRHAVIRLALQVNGKRLTTDEVLATLAEQVIGLTQSPDDRTITVPVDYEPIAGAGRISRFQPDPLTPDQADGVIRPWQQRDAAAEE